MTKRRRALALTLIVLLAVAGCGGDGDRVLVSKCYYDGTPWEPQRHDVVVFRFPREPIQNGSPTNYIKRLLGLAGETIAIFMGQVFVYTDIDYSNEPRPENDKDLWRADFRYDNHDNAVNAFQAGKFKIVRKSPATMLAMRRIVYDNNFQAADLKEAGFPRRWHPEDGWSADDAHKQFTSDGGKDEELVLRYQHFLRPRNWNDLDVEQVREQVGKDKNVYRELITDFSGYNTHVNPEHGMSNPQQNWVGDLMLETEVNVKEATGEFWLELSSGVDRFQARWDLESGVCKLVRIPNGAQLTVLAEKSTSVKGAGTYRIRFSNFDDRLTVWVNRSLPFGDGVEYDSARKFQDGLWKGLGPTENDIERPATVGVKGASVTVSNLKLWRDTYYHHGDRAAAYPSDAARNDINHADWSDLRTNPPLNTMYVQPGHFLVLGDNSPESSDSRDWGVVPKRLMLGRALMVYWPLGRIGTIIH